MKTLLDDRFAPITSRVGFIGAPLSAVGAALRDWRRSLGAEVAVLPVSERFPAVLHRLEPLTLADKQRELVLTTGSSWTAYFDNLANGPDPFGPVSYLSSTLECRGLMVTCVPHEHVVEGSGARGRYGAVQFEMFGPEPTEWLNYVRTISAVNDGGRWVFETFGPPQRFEKSERYTARRVRERFTAAMLEEYCAALGVRYFDPEFYRPEGLLFEVRGRLEPGAKVTAMTLEEARERLGIMAGP